MATNLVLTRPVRISACAASGHRKSDAHRRKQPSSNWWTPLFGLSSDPDYIDSDTNNYNNKVQSSPKSETAPDSDDPKPSRPRFDSLTDEKAKQLRMMTTDTSSFHDMYHSAIASRLASDFSDRSDL